MAKPTIGDPNTSVSADFDGEILPSSCPSMSDFRPICDSTHLDNPEEDPDFSDSILRYISQILMEEEFEEKDSILQESSKLQAAEKSFYEAIGKTYPPSRTHNFDSSTENVGCSSSDSYGFVDNRFGDRSALATMNSAYDLSGYNNTISKGVQSVPIYQYSESPSSSLSSVNKDGLMESPISSNNTLQVPDPYNGCQSVSLFIKGVEEARKLIPNNDELIISSKERCSNPSAKAEINKGLKGKKHRNRNFTDLEEEEEERSVKQAAVNPDPNVHSDIFDEILLDHTGDRNKAIIVLRETLKNESIKKTQLNVQSKGPGGRRKQNRKEVVDLRTLLISCAQAITAGDHRRATLLLTQIKQSSSPFGDGSQRLAHFLVQGLEARLSGNGSQVYRALVNSRMTSTSILKAYLVYLAACPFRKVSNLFSNRTISELTHSAAKIHIIDFGIHFGFQWPSLIQRQSERPGGSPKIRITGIGFPQAGFRPAQRVEETGRRLVHYAKEFGVPFEFNAIAKRWESIQLEDLKLEEDEVVIVNCIYRMKNLPDETMVADSCRNAIFNMIRKINPAVFIQGVVNGAYNAPFFLTRFREALFHFSSLFDMLDTVMPRESEERLLLEKEIFGKEAINVVGCEGWERVERPETYKQWQARTCRAGFVQLPLDNELKDKARVRVGAYHKEFVIDQDGQWLLLGWKGRIVYALSNWKPA